MAGLLTYNVSNRVVSQQVGYAILQAGVAGFLTNAQVVAATSADDLIANVLANVVSPGAEGFAQRNSIARSIQEGKNLGDLSDARVQAATSVFDLASTYTWVDQDSAINTGHLGTNIYG